MTVTEPNARLALLIAKFLDVELDPWQARMLQVMLAAHRQPAPVPDDLVLCGAVYDNSDPGNIIWCVLPLHHRVLHLASNGTSWADE